MLLLKSPYTRVDYFEPDGTKLATKMVGIGDSNARTRAY